MDLELFSSAVPYFPYFRILQILQSGLNVYWYRRHRSAISAEKLCQDLRKSAAIDKSLNLKNLQSAFLVLAIGLTAASAVFLLEMTCHVSLNRAE